MATSKPWLTVAALLLPCLAGCGDGNDTPPSSEEPTTAITNRIDVPPAVRENLGITFVEVTPRYVQRTRRIPGRFELLPQAHRAYHGTLAGQVELLVAQYQEIAPGQALFRVDSPAWREMQQSMVGTVIAIRKAKTRRDSIVARSRAFAEHAASLRDQRSVWEERLHELEQLASAGGGVRSARTEAKAEVASVATALAEVLEEEATLQAEMAMINAELEGHRESTPSLYADALGRSAAAGSGPSPARDLALARAAALLGVDIETLRERVGDGQDAKPRWRVIDHLEVLARQAGVVEALHVTNGAWIDVGAVVLGTVDPRQVRFRASGLQADLGLMSDGLHAKILPPGGAAAGAGTALDGILTIGIEADPLTRKIDLIVTPQAAERPHWARAGVSTEVEVVLEGTTGPQLAIPAASVIQDGLEKIIFRRDPEDPDKVIRLQADLGISDGRWVVLESGVMEGDEIVHHGVYELMLASGDATQEGGHFHADGTWHAGPDH
jgi:multidrug resistance efflux pump